MLAVLGVFAAPVQRRLRLDGVIAQLNLLLPRGELQPTRRAATW
ncbi:MAG: hypothetical protein WCQ89_05070 [Verrucomicrobiota bacterium]|jgi:hypothetical protein